MNTKYTIKNFRVFDEKGVAVDIKPITILTGCNSSGKSSIVKSMVLLNTYIDSLQQDYKAFNRIDLKKHKLDFGKDTTFSLGNFLRVLHHGSDNKSITFQYRVHSLLLGEDVDLSFVFVTDENDELREGFICEISISKVNGEVIYSSSETNPCTANYNLILYNFFRFVKGQFIVDAQREYKSRQYWLYGNRTEDEFHEDLKQLPTEWREREEGTEAYLKKVREALGFYRSSFVSAYGEEPLPDIENWVKQHGKDLYSLAVGSSEDKVKSFIEKWANGNIDTVDISLRWNTLFYFPLLEKLYNQDKASFKDALLAMLVDITCEEEVLYAINKISDDFTNSDCDTFGDYFKKKESDFLNFHSNMFRKGAPFIDGTKFFHVDDWRHENYLEWTKRMLGPIAVETPTGNLASMRGIGEYDEWKEYPVNFFLLYSVLMNLNRMIDSSESTFYYKKEKTTNEKYADFQHRVFDMFVDYATMVMREVVTSAMPQNLSYVGTSLVNVRRDYSLDANDSFTNLVKRYFAARRAYKNSKENGILGQDNFIGKWIRRFGLGYAAGIEMNESGSSFTVRLYKNADDKSGCLLAEEGYGVTQLVVLLLRIETAILESKKTLLNEDFDEDEQPIYSFSESTIAVEEPEVHLHPKFQSLLAEMFVDAYKNYNVHFIIETHSEYIVRKLQLLVANKEMKNSDISLLYVYDEKDRPGYEPQVKKIGIHKDGMLNGNFGEGFFDEADMLSMFLLTAQSDDNI